ncbi:MAG: hypothetical protein RR579_01500 [Eubacterium sp.]
MSHTNDISKLLNLKDPKNIKSGYGDFAIDIPRDRQGEYEPPF